MIILLGPREDNVLVSSNGQNTLTVGEHPEATTQVAHKQKYRSTHWSNRIKSTIHLLNKRGK